MQTGYGKKKNYNLNIKSCSVNPFYADMSSEVKPRFGFGSYSHITVYTQHASSHCTHSYRYSFIYYIYIYIYTHTYIDIQNIYSQKDQIKKKEAVVGLHQMTE